MFLGRCLWTLAWGWDRNIKLDAVISEDSGVPRWDGIGHVLWNDGHEVLHATGCAQRLDRHPRGDQVHDTRAIVQEREGLCGDAAMHACDAEVAGALACAACA